MPVSTKQLIEQYEGRIADLKSQIEDLRAISSLTNRTQLIPAVALEADAILSGKEETYSPTYTEEEVNASMAEASERDRILSGTY